MSLYNSKDLGLTMGDKVMKKRQIQRLTETLYLGELFSLMVKLQHPGSSSYVSCTLN